MANVIHGTEMILEMKDIDGEYYEVLCATDCSFERIPEFVEVTSPDSGMFQEFIQRREGWSMSASGLTKVNNDTSLSFFYMLQTSVRRQKKDFRITFDDGDGNTKQISGSAFIGSETISGSASDFVNCTIELKGTGAFSVGAVSPPVVGTLNIYSDWWTPTAGNNYIDGSSSGQSPAAVQFGGVFNLGATDTILDVHVEGDHKNIITSGSPGNLECKFNSMTGVISFKTDLIFLGTEKVWVEFQRT